MKHMSVVKVLERAGLIVRSNGRRDYWTDTPTDRIAWIRMSHSGCTGPCFPLQVNDIAVCLRVRRLRDHDDLQSDYTAGEYVNSIRQALRLAGTN